MNSIKNFFWKNKLAISACVLTISFGVGYWVLSNPGPTSIGENITVGNNLYVTGNVGIGTTTPGAKLHVGGTVGTDGIMFPDGTLQTTASDGSIGAFGDWTNLDSTGGTLVKEAVYKATTDGFVVYRGTGPGNDSVATGYTDSIDATTPRVAGSARDISYGTGLTMPVRKDDYWKVVSSGGTGVIYWQPIGTGAPVRQ